MPLKGAGEAALPGILVRVQFSHKMAVPLCRIADRHTALHCVYSKNSRKLLVGSSKAILCCLGTAIGCAGSAAGGWRWWLVRRQSPACAPWLLRTPHCLSHAGPGLCWAVLGAWPQSVLLPSLASSPLAGVGFYFIISFFNRAGYFGKQAA